MRKKDKVGGITLSYIKTYYTATVIKSVWYWQEDRYTDQWDWIKTQKETHTNMPDWFLTKVQNQVNGGKIVFSTNGARANGYP